MMVSSNVELEMRCSSKEAVATHSFSFFKLHHQPVDRSLIQGGQGPFASEFLQGHGMMVHCHFGQQRNQTSRPADLERLQALDNLSHQFVCFALWQSASRFHPR